MTNNQVNLYRQGEGSNLVFIHGYLGAKEIWQPLIDRLSKHFCCITLDLPGFGENAHQLAPDSISDMASIVIDTLKINGVDQPFILGHSMGGQIVQEMLCQNQTLFSKAILYGTGPRGAMPGRFETIEASIKRVHDNGVQNAAYNISASWFLDYDRAEDFIWVKDLSKSVSLQSAENCLVAMRNWNCVPKLPDVTIPVCIIWGDSDRSYLWSEQELLRNNLPQASLAVMPKTAHIAHVEAPEIFSVMLCYWLR